MADVRDRPLLRGLLAVCQTAGILLTWPLWQVRSGTAAPPNLPIWDALDGFQIPLGGALIATLVVAMFWPRVGAISHGLVLALAICLDQLRIQPQFISLAILLAGTVPRRGPLLLARSHLIALWLWAGLHKLLSAEYYRTTGPDLVQGLLPGMTDQQALILGIATAAGELLLGLAAIFPQTRRKVPHFACALHGVVLLTIVCRGWNTAVWPWNLALMVAGYGFIADWTEPIWSWDTTGNPTVESASVRRSAAISSPWQRRLWQSAALVLLAYPALFYVNLCDGYLAWCVYSSNVPEAVIYDSWSPEGERLFDRAYEPLNVPFSPAVRLCEEYFRRVGAIDDRLEIDDPRPYSLWQGRGKRTFVFAEEGPVEIQH
jgi:hypothetical protein